MNSLLGRFAQAVMRCLSAPSVTLLRRCTELGRCSTALGLQMSRVGRLQAASSCFLIRRFPSRQALIQLFIFCSVHISSIRSFDLEQAVTLP